MGETPEQLWERARHRLRTPPLETWETWPFDGAATPRPLRPPEAEERARLGAGGLDCEKCARSDEDYLWTADHWRVGSFPRPTGLPCIVILEPRDHADLPSLSAARAAELGPFLIRVQAAVFAIGEIGNVHICRWGDGSAGA